MSDSPSVVRFGVFELDRRAGVLRKAGVRLNLQPQPFEVLALLVEHPGELVTRDDMRRRLWPDDTFVDFQHGLNAVMNRLRETLGDSAVTPRFIETVPRRGYWFVAPVQSAPVGAPRLDPIPKRRTHLLRSIAAILAVVILVLLGAGSAVGWRWRPPGLLSASWRGAASNVSGGDPSLPPMRTVPLSALPGAEESPSFSPDGSHIAFAWSRSPAEESRIAVKRIGDDSLRELTRGAMDGSPAWSPDGRLIAFARNGCPSARGAAGDRALSGLYVVPASGGPVRRLYSGSLCGGPKWSPDGRTLVFSLEALSKDASLFELSMDTLSARRLTSTAGWTVAPTFSPDGKTLAFIKMEAGGSDIYLLPSRGGTPKRLTFDSTNVGGIAWTQDGTAIIYSSSRGGSPGFWRIASEGGHSERLPVAGEGGFALDQVGRRLAFVQGRGSQMHITAFDLRNARSTPVAIAESSRSEHSASFSWDGRKIAFGSDRGGDSAEIWVADSDGANPIRLTFFGKGFSGSPQWSPDGEWVAFDSTADGQFDVLTVRTAGSAPRRLTPGGSNEYAPSWSRDGRWIYFGSDRSGKDQVWRMPSGGGDAIQITRDGGLGGVESHDGHFLYYAKGNDQPGIWRIPVHGGREEPVLPEYPAGAYGRYWALVENRLYYLNTRNQDRQSVESLDLTTRRIKRILNLPTRACPWYSPDLAVSPDERTLLICLQSPGESDIMLVENFR